MQVRPSLYEVWLKLDETKRTVAKWQNEIEDVRRIFCVEPLNLEEIYKQAYESMGKLQEIIDQTIEDCRKEAKKRNL